MRLSLLMLLIVSPTLGEELPIFGEATFSTQETKFDLGTYYVGEKITGVIALKNDTQRSFSIEDVHTSCGCTAARYKDQLIGPGKIAPLRTKIHFTKRGDFVIRIRIDYDGIALPILLTADVKAVVDIVPPIKADGENLLVALKVNDPDGDPLELIVAGGERINACGQTATFRVPGRMAKNGYVTLTMRLKDIDLPPLVTTIKQKGKLRLPATYLYASHAGEEYRFRLFLAGDLSIIKPESVFRFRHDGKEFPIVVEPKLVTGAFVANCTAVEMPMGNVELVIDKTVVPVTTKAR